MYKKISVQKQIISLFTIKQKETGYVSIEKYFDEYKIFNNIYNDIKYFDALNFFQENVLSSI